MSTPASSDPATLDDWVELLSSEEMPIFSNTANNICLSLDDSKKGAMELASIIMQDPNLTAKLLKMSNSSYFNPSSQKINTISRAIVILGAKTIRELTLACAFFESILSSANKERANQEIGEAIHSAVQAKQIAIMTNDPSPEEVFVAALLQNIGKVAFWCFAHKQAEQVCELINTGNFSQEEAEKKILGFKLQQLSGKLAHSWHLGGLIEDSINQAGAKNKRAQLVQMGRKIIKAVEAGEHSDPMLACLTELSRLTGASLDTIKTRIKQNTETAVSMAIKFGAHDASRFIEATKSIGAVAAEENNVVLTAQQIQFQILQEISDHISSAINLNILFEMVMEGIHRGVGMDRTLFLLLTADKNSLLEKFSLGWHQEPDQKIQLKNNNQPNILFECIQNQESQWVFPSKHRRQYGDALLQTIGLHESFIVPILTERKVIGLIYCDRKNSNTPFTKKEFTTVQHFCKQANIGLSLYRTRTL